MFTPARAVQQRISGAENWKSPYSPASLKRKTPRYYNPIKPTQFRSGTLFSETVARLRCRKRP
jgi:hypothetical protein